MPAVMTSRGPSLPRVFTVSPTRPGADDDHVGHGLCTPRSCAEHGSGPAAAHRQDRRPSRGRALLGVGMADDLRARHVCSHGAQPRSTRCGQLPWYGASTLRQEADCAQADCSPRPTAGAVPSRPAAREAPNHAQPRSRIQAYAPAVPQIPRRCLTHRAPQGRLVRADVQPPRDSSPLSATTSRPPGRTHTMIRRALLIP